MKNFVITTVSIIAVLAASILIGGGANVQAALITDDFSDLNDTANPAWTHLSGLTASTGQTWDASTGQYRMTAPNNGFSNYGFVGSHVATEVYTDVTTAADIVSFVPYPGGAFGVMARSNGNNGFNALKAYGYAYEPFADSGLGEMVLYKIVGASLVDLGSQKVTLNSTKDYTFVLDVQGTQLHGQVWEIGGGMVAEKFATDAEYASGTSGLFGYSQAPLPATDVTWDNFKTVPEPATSLLVALGACAIFVSRRFPRGCN
jgi:hypothetical protein